MFPGKVKLIFKEGILEPNYGNPPFFHSRKFSSNFNGQFCYCCFGKIALALFPSGLG